MEVGLVVKTCICPQRSLLLFTDVADGAFLPVCYLTTGLFH